MTNKPNRPTGTLLTTKQVMDKIGLGQTTLWKLRRLGLFPKPHKIGMRKNGWYESEIDDWIQNQQPTN